ncbi:MAG TPA: SIS domain-containing protein [Bacteroidia bacterium]|jgi:D-sedoheptulose 7-phosphate isomerase
MPLNLYKKVFNEYFSSEEFGHMLDRSVGLVAASKRIFFIGNGGSNAICSHMMEDYAKIAGYPTFSFSDAALITCFANDYGYEQAIKEWLKIHFMPGDLLVAISSSGNSPNILNAADEFNSLGGKTITLSGFRADNKLRGKGEVNFHIPVENYGIVECYHQVILHLILDTVSPLRKKS